MAVLASPIMVNFFSPHLWGVGFLTIIGDANLESEKVNYFAYFYVLKIEMREKEREKQRLEKKSKVILKHIVNRRKELGLTQWDLAELLNLTSSGYYKVETGKTKLDTIRLLEILEKLEISVEDFFKGFK